MREYEFQNALVNKQLKAISVILINTSFLKEDGKRVLNDYIDKICNIKSIDNDNLQVGSFERLMALFGAKK